MAGIEGEPDKPDWQAVDEQIEKVEAEEEAAHHG